jgi:hypothetical protein
MMLISIYSPSGIYDSKFLANYAYINLYDQLSRVPGIGSVQVFGRRQVRDAAVGEAGPTGEARHHSARKSSRRSRLRIR